MSDQANTDGPEGPAPAFDGEAFALPETGDLEERLAHAFEERELLYRALTHRSFANELPGEFPDNEVLEFLGDAVLGLVVSDLLYRRHPELTEGEMSKIKSYLVSTPTLARVAEDVALGESLLLGRGEEKSAGRAKDSLLANTFEAVIAALYLDAGLDEVRDFVDKTLGGRLAAAVEADTSLHDFKSVLQERLQADGRDLPDYDVVAELGPDHDKIFRVEVSVEGERLAEGEGKTKKGAEQNAARKALKLYR